MSYTRWICFTTALTLIFTGGGVWLEQRLRGEPAASASTLAGTPAPELQVLVTGAVGRPGLYRLPAGSRVETLLALAGGTTPEARLSGLALDRPLNSGEVLNVPAAHSEDGDETDDAKTGDQTEAQDEPQATSTRHARKARNHDRTSSKTRSRPTRHESATAAAGEPISLNRATVADFERLPGVGPALAARMLNWRRSHGAYSSIEDLLQVKGIGPKKLAKMKGMLKL